MFPFLFLFLFEFIFIFLVIRKCRREEAEELYLYTRRALSIHFIRYVLLAAFGNNSLRRVSTVDFFEWTILLFFLIITISLLAAVPYTNEKEKNKTAMMKRD